MSDYPVVAIPKLWENTGSENYKGGNSLWSVARLIELSKDLPVFEAPIAAICTDYTSFNSENLTEFVAHMKRCLEVDTSRPIILASNGVIMDGRHRLARAILDGKTTIKAVRFDVTPQPDSEVGS